MDLVTLVSWKNFSSLFPLVTCVGMKCHKCDCHQKSLNSKERLLALDIFTMRLWLLPLQLLGEGDYHEQGNSITKDNDTSQSDCYHTKNAQ